VPLAHAAGARVTTIEALGGRHRLQRAFRRSRRRAVWHLHDRDDHATLALGPRPSIEAIAGWSGGQSLPVYRLLGDLPGYRERQQASTCSACSKKCDV